MSNLKQAAQAALEALIESVDLVQNDYDSDWRHGMPTRASQLAASLGALNAHKKAIEALRTALAEQPEQELFNCAIEPRPLNHSLHEYHIAMSEGPLHYTWTDKPHRLVYDLIAAVKYYAAPPQQRTLLEQYDLDQSADYRKGYEDGRLKGYEVGHRHASQQRQPLTTWELVTMYAECPRSDTEMIEFARAIEAAHDIKESK